MYRNQTIIYLTLILGDFRNGKSFLMNFLIRYLEAKGAQDWIYKDEEFWVPKDKPQEQSLLKKGMGFIYRSDVLSLFPISQQLFN
jgi:hypothetical protein